MIYLIRAAALFFFFCIIPAAASAQNEHFYHNDYIDIFWPKDIAHTPCSDALKVNAGQSCMRLGNDGSLGAVFISVHDGYSLSSAEQLKKHLQNSESALADIPNIHVMQSGILSQNPLMGIMEILRNDGTLNDISALQNTPVRQTSILIPYNNSLAQIFIYLPLENNNNFLDVDKYYSKIIDSIVNTSKVSGQSLTEDSQSSSIENAPTDGALSLLPRAIIIGLLIAAAAIAFLAMRAFFARREKEQRDKAAQRSVERMDMDFEFDADADSLPQNTASDDKLHASASSDSSKTE